MFTGLLRVYLLSPRRTEIFFEGFSLSLIGRAARQTRQMAFKLHDLTFHPCCSLKINLNTLSKRVLQTVLLKSLAGTHWIVTQAGNNQPMGIGSS